jgi:flavorubredoxin
MDTPTQLAPLEIAADTFVLPAYMPLPGMGVLPMSSFLIRGEHPVLVDTGPGPLADELVADLETLVDLDDLDWIWLTHTDPDHIGAVSRLLERAPNARVVTTFLGAGKMGLHTPIPPERTYLINPGQSLAVGDRELRALRPPVFDAPETIAPFDTRTGAFFAADCFGTLMAEPVPSADALTREALRDGMVTWASIDAPWLEMIDESRFDDALKTIARLEPSVVLGSHVPPATGMTERLIECLGAARGVTPFVGPDQAAVEQAMANAA